MSFMRLRTLLAHALMGWLLLLACRTVSAATWHVRPDGGTRYTAEQATGQCDGTADAAYPGKGVNQHCAFKDVRFLWMDGSYCGDSSPFSKCWKWVGQGGDTYLIHGSIADGVTYRVGQSGPEAHDYFGGLAGNPYAAGAPPPPSGTEAAHTKILGANYQSCSAQKTRTQLHGGYGVGAVLNLSGASFVDVACLDITDLSPCGKIAQTTHCQTSYPLDDYADDGLVFSNKSTHDTVSDVRIHGMASTGIIGPTGDGMVLNDVALIGNAAAGWNADPGNGTTGWGSLLIENFDISWNGCTEEYPIVDKLPYGGCTDDNAGGYGDGFGTATAASNPGWKVRFEKGVVSYNTQDGLDALHLYGNGSSMTITHVLAYGNMGQQIKIGGNSGSATHNRIFTNCNAMRQAIPGTPAGYNKLLSDFCRAADAGIAMMVNDGSTAVFSDNILFSASATAIEVDVDTSCKTPTCLIQQQRNIFIGFKNDVSNGYSRGGSDDYSNPVYAEKSAAAYRNPDSHFDHNVTFHAKSNWRCPAVQLHEKDAYCGDPHLVDESWPLFGYVADTNLTRPIPFGSSASGPKAANAGDAPRRPTGVLLASVGGLVLLTCGTIGWRRYRR